MAIHMPVHVFLHMAMHMAASMSVFDGKANGCRGCSTLVIITVSVIVALSVALGQARVPSIWASD